MVIVGWGSKCLHMAIQDVCECIMHLVKSRNVPMPHVESRFHPKIIRNAAKQRLEAIKEDRLERSERYLEEAAVDYIEYRRKSWLRRKFKGSIEDAKDHLFANDEVVAVEYHNLANNAAAEQELTLRRIVHMCDVITSGAFYCSDPYYIALDAVAIEEIYG